MALTSQIYITGLPPTAAEHDIAAHFGTIGAIKVDRRTGDAKVLLYRDRGGALKGDASGVCVGGGGLAGHVVGACLHACRRPAGLSCHYGSPAWRARAWRCRLRDAGGLRPPPHGHVSHVPPHGHVSHVPLGSHARGQ